MISTPTLSSCEGWRNSFKRVVNHCFATTFSLQHLRGPMVRNSNSKSEDSIRFTALNNYLSLISSAILDSMSTVFNNSASLIFFLIFSPLHLSSCILSFKMTHVFRIWWFFFVVMITRVKHVMFFVVFKGFFCSNRASLNRWGHVWASSPFIFSIGEMVARSLCTHA